MPKEKSQPQGSEQLTTEQQEKLLNPENKEQLEEYLRAHIETPKGQEQAGRILEELRNPKNPS